MGSAWSWSEGEAGPSGRRPPLHHHTAQEVFLWAEALFPPARPSLLIIPINTCPGHLGS